MALYDDLLLGGRAAMTPGEWSDAVIARCPLLREPPTVDDDAAVATAREAYHAEGNRHPYWRLLRDRAPVVVQGGIRLLTRRDDVLAALRNPAVFAPLRRTTFAAFGVEGVPVSHQGAAHRRYRRILNPLFSPHSVAASEASLRELAAGLVDAVAARGECEVIGDVADAFAGQALMLAVGFPREDWARVLGLVGQIVDPGLDSHVLPKRRLLEYISSTIVTVGKRSRRGVLAHLLYGDEPLSRPELLGLYSLFFIAGINSVAATIGFALLALARSAQLRMRLREDPALIPAFVDEVIRVESPAGTIPRVTTEKVTVGGFTLPAGSYVELSLGAINSEDSEKIEMAADGRARRRHWAFGGGAHRCLGSHLVRMEMAVFLDEWLKRLPEFELAPGFVPKIVSAGGDKLASLPLIWATQ